MCVPLHVRLCVSYARPHPVCKPSGRSHGQGQLVAELIGGSPCSHAARVSLINHSCLLPIFSRPTALVRLKACVVASLRAYWLMGEIGSLFVLTCTRTPSSVLQVWSDQVTASSDAMEKGDNSLLAREIPCFPLAPNKS